MTQAKKKIAEMEKAGAPAKTAELIAKGHTIKTDIAPTPYKEDKRENARHEHTNHFTNRADSKGQ